MKNKILWIFSGFNLLVVIGFFIALNKQNPSQTTQILHIIAMMIGFLIIEIPIILLILNSCKDQK